ncbi:MAG: hypothetical protein JEZ03_17325 [Bacteroidales bacterium]|nr:hypothetical protein [Bacteroidales bacterium]
MKNKIKENRLLIIDESVDILKILTQIPEDKYYTISYTTERTLALEIDNKVKSALILLNIMMP